MTNIATLQDLKDWANDGNTGTLTTNITIPSGTTGFPLTLVTGSILDGNGFTITIESGFTSHLFVPAASATVQVKDVEITVNNTPMSTGVLFGAITVNNVTITVTDCAVNGTFTLGSEYGGVIGRIILGVSNFNCTVTGCYCTGTISGTGGGIIGRVNSDNHTVVITDCYTTGNIGANGGGIAGKRFGNNTVTGNNIVRRCYSFGTIVDDAGGIVGRDSGVGSSVQLIIDNCYSFGAITGRGAGILGRESNNATISNCYARGTTSLGEGDGNYFGTTLHTNIIVSKCQAAAVAGTWNATLNADDTGNGLHNTGSVWTDSGSFSTGFGLTRFKAAPWDTTYYNDNNDNAQFLQSGGGGDPHITTLDGVRYDLLSKGVFNLFDNNINEARLVINGDTIVPDHPIWSDKEYINNLFISYKGKNITVKPGFRGRNAEILDIDEDFENDPHVTITSNVNEPLNADHKLFCNECKYRTRDRKLMCRHRRKAFHSVLPSLRNSINVTIQDEYNVYNIMISNVNRDNFHPSSVTLKLQDKRHYATYSGAVTKAHDEYDCDIEHLHYVKDLQ